MGPASPLSKPGKQRGAPDRRDRSGLLQATDGELIDPRGLGDILYPALADILEGHVELAVDRVEGWPGYADPAGFGEGFQARGHVDVVATMMSPTLMPIRSLMCRSSIMARRYFGPYTTNTIDH